MVWDQEPTNANEPPGALWHSHYAEAGSTLGQKKTAKVGEKTTHETTMSAAAEPTTFEDGASDLPDPKEEPEDSVDDEEDEEDEEGEEGEEDQDDDEGEESDFVGASDLEEGAKYADQPACGLSPRIVLRRGVETLRALDPPAEGSPSSGKPALTRMDTVASFESAVGTMEPDALASPAPAIPALGRVDTMSAHPAVAEAFAAVGDTAGASSSSAATPAPAPAPLGSPTVRRVDTMELLANVGDGDDESDAARATKRTKFAV